MNTGEGETDEEVLITGTAMTASQMRIAETIDAFYGDAGANDGVSRSYKQAVEDLDAETIKALDGPYRYDLAHIDLLCFYLPLPRSERGEDVSHIGSHQTPSFPQTNGS